MQIGQIMSKEVITVNMDTSLETISRIFNEKRFHHVLVVWNDKLIGVISDRDLFKALSPFLNTMSEQTRDLNTLKKKAHQIMSRDLITITKEEILEDAVKLLLIHSISCLPVISPEGQIQGIVTWRDILFAYAYRYKFAHSDIIGEL